MRRVLLTGGTGFVGASLARRLLREGHEVHLLVRPQHGSWRLEGIADAVRLQVVDTADAAAVRQAVRAGRPDWVFHLMAHGAYASQTDSTQIARTNLEATMLLLDACVAEGVEAFVHAGSSSEYGLVDHAPSETERLAPNSAYAVTKAAATHYGQHVGRTTAVRVVTLRLYSVYGPWEEPSRLVPTLLSHALRGELPALVNPAVARDFVFVEDVNDAFLRAASASGLSPGAVFNIGSGEQQTVGDLVARVRRLFGVQHEPCWGSMPDRQWDTSVWVADARLARSQLGWSGEVTLDAGLRETARWLQEDPGRLDFYWRGARKQ